MALLLRHPFWGNIRELKAYIADAVARCTTGCIEEELLSDRLASAASAMAGQTTKAATNPLESLFGHFPSLDELADYAVDVALSSTQNNQNKAAQLLGVSRQALHKRLKKREGGRSGQEFS